MNPGGSGLRSHPLLHTRFEMAMGYMRTLSNWRHGGGEGVNWLAMAVTRMIAVMMKNFYLCTSKVETRFDHGLKVNKIKA